MSELNPNELARQCAEAMFANDACSQHLGLEIESVSPGEAVMTMRVQPWMLNGHGSIQGGILFTFADAAFALCLQRLQQGDHRPGLHHRLPQARL
ncbi:hotdog fold thioesterase [Oceanimonas sp. NS1]|nr:hotdog fold thioesterase [Oceanimonas sp. NS1]